MTLQINPKKPFADYTEAGQQAILSKGQALLLQKLEQGESRSLEDTWCMLAFQRTQREVRFKPTVEKIVKEKALTKAQKVEILEKFVQGSLTEVSDKEQSVIDELVGLGKEYYIFTLQNSVKELMKMTKTNIKKKFKELQAKREDQTVFELLDKINPLTQSEQEFLIAMTKEG